VVKGSRRRVTKRDPQRTHDFIVRGMVRPKRRQARRQGQGAEGKKVSDMRVAMLPLAGQSKKAKREVKGEGRRPFVTQKGWGGGAFVQVITGPRIRGRKKGKNGKKWDVNNRNCGKKKKMWGRRNPGRG